MAVFLLLSLPNQAETRKQTPTSGSVELQLIACEESNESHLVGYDEPSVALLKHGAQVIYVEKYM